MRKTDYAERDGKINVLEKEASRMSELLKTEGSLTFFCRSIGIRFLWSPHH
jgi:hypothetical protein